MEIEIAPTVPYLDVGKKKKKYKERKPVQQKNCVICQAEFETKGE